MEVEMRGKDDPPEIVEDDVTMQKRTATRLLNRILNIQERIQALGVKDTELTSIYKDTETLKPYLKRIESYSKTFFFRPEKRDSFLKSTAAFLTEIDGDEHMFKLYLFLLKLSETTKFSINFFLSLNDLKDIVKRQGLPRNKFEHYVEGLELYKGNYIKVDSFYWFPPFPKKLGGTKRQKKRTRSKRKRMSRKY